MVAFLEKLQIRYRIQNELVRNLLSEFFGTALLLFIGNSINAQHVLSREAKGAWIGVNLGWGLNIVFCVQMCSKVSGGHLNPAVSLFLFTYGRLSAVRLILYSIVQLAGAFCGAALAYLIYYDAINAFKDAPPAHLFSATAGIFATYPAAYLSILGGLFDQIMGTAVLCLGAAVVLDHRNDVPHFLHPLFFGLLVMLIGMAFGMNAGYPINPARDLGPRIFTLFAGYGWQVFSYRNYMWFWVPIIGPMIGAVVGAWIYQIFIAFHIPDSKDWAKNQNDKPHPLLKVDAANLDEFP